VIRLELPLGLGHGVRGHGQHFKGPAGQHPEGRGEILRIAQASCFGIEQPGQEPLAVQLLVAGKPGLFLGVGLLDAADIALHGVQDPVHVGHQDADPLVPGHPFQPFPQNPEVIADRFKERVQGHALARPAGSHLTGQGPQIRRELQPGHLVQEHVHGVRGGPVHIILGHQRFAIGNRGKALQEVVHEPGAFLPQALQQFGPFRLHGPARIELPNHPAGRGRGSVVVDCHAAILCKSLS